MTRISRISRRAVLPALLSLTLSGCLWYFYPADAAAELLLYESFNELNTWETWTAGVSLGGEPDFVVRNGRIEIYGPGHFIRTQDRYPVASTMLIDWSVLNGDVTAHPFPAANAEIADFSVVFDALNVRVALLLYRPDGLTFVDSVRIQDLNGQDIIDPATVASAGATRGQIRIDIADLAEKYEVAVRVPECGLETAAVVAAPGRDDSRFGVMVNGLRNDPRCLEELVLYRTPPAGGLP